MDSPTEGWHSWEIVNLRRLPISQLHSALPGVLYRRLSWNTQHFMHRLVLLTWIGENELAKKLWEEEKEQHYFWKVDFEDFLFRVLILKGSLSGKRHPEFSGIVEYLLLEEEDAFKLSTTSLFELLKMDKPHFSSVDGLITVDFNKHELVRIANIVPERYHKQLRLPLILLRKEAGYMEPYKHIGTKLENMLLQRLLKLTKAPFENFAKIEEKRKLTSISMLRRRKFNTIYKVLPENSTIWLNIAYEYPSLH
jgi:uncharacterized protein (UPF0216 family)